MIDPAFFSSESLAECSHTARLCFIGMWCQAKDDGRMRFSPRSLKSSIFPMDEMSMENFLKAVCELEEEGCVKLYVNGDEVYVYIPNFKVYQTISHPQKSNIPEPSMSVPVMLHECSMNVPPKELIKELVNKARGGDADAPPAPYQGAEDWKKDYLDKIKER